MAETNLEVTEDALYGGRVRLRQPARGYRANVDTVLLAAAVRPLTGPGRVAELGCGAGAALLMVANNHEQIQGIEFLGVERDPVSAELARANAANNSAVQIAQVDAFSPDFDWGVFDRVFFNPPYDEEGVGRPPAENRQAAYIADRPLADWIKVWSNRMGAGAELALIQRAHRLPEILGALQGRLGGAVVYPIRTSASAKAHRIIVRAQKGSRAPMTLLPGLDLHPEGHDGAKYTPEAEAILRGEVLIALS